MIDCESGSDFSESCDALTAFFETAADVMSTVVTITAAAAGITERSGTFTSHFLKMKGLFSSVISETMCIPPSPAEPAAPTAAKTDASILAAVSEARVKPATGSDIITLRAAVTGESVSFSPERRSSSSSAFLSVRLA